MNNQVKTSEETFCNKEAFTIYYWTYTVIPRQGRSSGKNKLNFVRNLTGPINVLFQLNMKYQDQQQKLKRKRGTDSYKLPRWAMWEGGWGTKT